MRELAVFSRQFATLVASGMPMLRSLYTLEEQTEDEMLKEAIGGVRDDVEAGQLAGAGDGAPARRSSTALSARWSAPARARDASRRRSTGSPTSSRRWTRCAAQVRSAMMYPAFVFRLRDRDHARGRRSSSSRCSSSVFNELAAGTARRVRAAAAHDPDHASASPTWSPATGSSAIPACSACVVGFFQLEEDRSRAAAVGPRQAATAVPRSATSSRRSRWRAGRARSRARSPPACRSCRRSS